MNHLHPIFQQALAPFVAPAKPLKQQIRDAIAHGSDPVIEHNGDTWRWRPCGSGVAVMCPTPAGFFFQGGTEMDYDRWLDRKWDEYCESYDRTVPPYHDRDACLLQEALLAGRQPRRSGNGFVLAAALALLAAVIGLLAP
jgi:hypothetical protein